MGIASITLPMPDSATHGITFEACYEAHRQRVYHLCLRYGGGNASWAEDVTHDVFIKLLEHLPTLDNPDDLGGWLYRVAANLSLSRLRHSRSVLARFLPRFGAGLVDSEPAPDAAFEQREAAAAAVATLQALPPRERIAICMKVLDGKSQKEIADTLSLSEGYVSKLLARAWEKIEASGWEGNHGEA